VRPDSHSHGRLPISASHSIRKLHRAVINKHLIGIATFHASFAHLSTTFAEKYVYNLHKTTLCGLLGAYVGRSESFEEAGEALI
jgi:hypothetical protein